jgi:hypothetical protein
MATSITRPASTQPVDALFPAPVCVMRYRSPAEEPHHGSTEADLRALLQYLQRCAWSIFNRPGHSDHIVQQNTSCWEVQHPALASHRRDTHATKLAKKRLRYHRWKVQQAVHYA